MLYYNFTDKINKRGSQLKRLLLFALISVGSVFTAYADKYQIIKLSTSTITIGGKTMKVGSTFNDVSEIKWTSNPQSMTIKNLTNNRVQRLTRKQMESKEKVKSLKEFYLRSEKLSTRRVGNSGAINFIETDNSANFPERRLALVIGNSDYSSLTELKNPINDASDLTDKLLDLGFDVIVSYDANYQDLRNALIEFSDKAVNYKAAMFYFSGHGVQSDNRCYLIPVENRLELHSDLNSCLECNDVLSALDATRCETRIAFFDACRDVKTTWTRSVNQEVSNVEASPGTMVFFSTRSGRVAQDGDGKNSPFATSLLRNISEPIEVSELASRVVKETYINTSQVQYPINTGMLLTDFKFNPNGTSKRTYVAPTPSASKQEQPTQQQPAQSQQQNQQSAVAPSGERPTVTLNTSDFFVKAIYAKRSGTEVAVDIYITNKTEESYRVNIIGNNMKIATEAYDSNGKTYEMLNGLKIRESNGDIGGILTCPPDVPVKFTVELSNVSSSVTYFPLINVALEYLGSRNIPRTTEVKLKNWIFQGTGQNLNSTPTQRPQTQNAQSLTTPTGEKSSISIGTSNITASASLLKRSGNEVTFNLYLTNTTEESYRVGVIGNNMKIATEAYDSNGKTYDVLNGFLIYKDSEMIGGGHFVCPPGVRIKITIRLSNVSSSVTYFPLINVALEYIGSSNNPRTTEVKLKNWIFQGTN